MIKKYCLILIIVFSFITIVSANTYCNQDGCYTSGNITARYFIGDGSLLTGVPTINPFDQVLNTTSEVDFAGINITGHTIINSSKGAEVHLDNFVTHTQEMMSDTLLDKSRSTLSCVDGKLNYTLVAFYGDGQFNFDGVLYPSDHTGVDNATITLNCGTDISPMTNHVYWELVGDVPTIKISSTYPTGSHIDVATFVIGACSGTNYNVYSYSRNRYEVDTFIKRVISRFEDSGTLYVSGFAQAANTTQLNVTSGGKFFNGIFEMTSTNTIKLSQGFYYINGTGHFKNSTNLDVFTAYADGVPFSGGTNERVNIVWGLVPINTTGGLGPTQMRLVAVLPNKPTTTYNSVAEAIADIYSTTNYYPPSDEIKTVFVPIARTILRPNTDVFEPFSTGVYYQDIRGRITSGGGSSASTGNTYWTLLGNVLTTITGTYQLKVNEILINNTNGLFSALSAKGNLDSYYQFNIQNLNNGSFASSDIVATANNGDESNYYIDMGINSANYSEPKYNITGKNDGYLYMQNGSLGIGTTSTNTFLKFFVGGATTSNEQMNLTTRGLSVINNITAKNINAQNNFSINGVNGLTKNYHMNNTIGSCWMNFTGGLLTWSDC